MKSFYYFVKDRKGEISRGVIRAKSEAEAEEHFRKNGYLVLSIEEETKQYLQHKNTLQVSASNIIKAVAVFIIIGAIYAYVELKKHRPSHEKPIFEKLREIVPEAKPLIEEPQEDALGSMPDITKEVEPEDNVVRIKMRGSKENKTDQPSGDSYYKAIDYYNYGTRSRSKRLLREAIRHAQYVLSSSQSESVREQMRQIIRESRRILWDAKTY